MDRPAAGPGPATGGLTLAAVLHAGLPLFRRTYRLPRYQWKILSAIQQCRTPALGGHRYPMRPGTFCAAWLRQPALSAMSGRAGG